MKKNYTNNMIDVTKKSNTNNISQNKTSNNLFISSKTKTNKENNYKTIAKNIKSNITKKKLFATTEKTITHKKPIYNHKIIKNNKNSNSINSNKYKKNYQEIISISVKPSISPPNTKVNTFKFKLIDNIIANNKSTQSNILVYNNNNNSNNNISYITKNKKMKSFQLNDNNDTEKINISNNKNDKKLNKNNSNNLNNGKKNVKEIMKNYKNMLKTKKNSHYSHDIKYTTVNKNNLFLNNKNVLNNITEKSLQKNTTNRKSRKTDQHKYISPINKKDTLINGNNPKTPFKPDIKINNKFQNMIIKTKEASQAKIQNYIKKILDKNNNKKNCFKNQSKTKQKLA